MHCILLLRTLLLCRYPWWLQAVDSSGPPTLPPLSITFETISLYHLARLIPFGSQFITMDMVDIWIAPVNILVLSLLTQTKSAQALSFCVCHFIMLEIKPRTLQMLSKHYLRVILRFYTKFLQQSYPLTSPQLLNDFVSLAIKGFFFCVCVFSFCIKWSNTKFDRQKSPNLSSLQLVFTYCSH